MKKLSILLLACLLGASLWAQDPYEWVKQLPLGGTYNGIRVASNACARITLDATGNIYVASRGKQTSGSYVITMAKYNPMGQELWSKVFYYASASNMILDLILHPQGVVINGYLSDSLMDVNSTLLIPATNNKDLPFFLFFDDLGSFSSGTLALADLMPRPNGELWNVTKTHSGNITSLTSINSALTTILDTMWTLPKGNPNIFNQLGISFLHHHYVTDSVSVFAGEVRDTQQLASNYTATAVSSVLHGPVSNFITQYYGHDSIVWYKQINNIGSSQLSIESMTTDNQGDMYLVCTSRCYQCDKGAVLDSFQLLPNSSSLIKIAANGTVLWLKRFGRAGSIEATHIYGDDLLISGTYRNFSNSLDDGWGYCSTITHPGKILNFNEDPTDGYAATQVYGTKTPHSKSGRRIGGNYYDVVTDMAVGSDGAVYITLSSNSDTIYFDGHPTTYRRENGNVFIAKMYPWAVGVEDNTEAATRLLLSPNPAQTFFTIDTRLRYDKVEIRNLLGQIIQTIHTSEPQYIPITSLANGMYWVIVSRDNEMLSTQKLVIDK